MKPEHKEPAPSKGNILCLGPTPCLQRTLWFQGLSPGAVNRASRVTESASGKGCNVARIVHQLGYPSHYLGISGGPVGSRFEELLAQDHFDYTLIRSEAETRTCQTLIDAKQSAVTELVEEAEAIRPEEANDYLTQALTCLAQACVVILSGSLPPGMPLDCYARLVQAAQQRGIPTVVDTQRVPLQKALTANPFLIKVNEHELLALSDKAGTSLDRAIDLTLAQGAGQLLITRGPEPALWVTQSERFLISPPKIQAINPIGSGDATAAGFGVGLIRGYSPFESACYGLACGSANALTETSGQVNPADVEGLTSQVHSRKVE